MLVDVGSAHSRDARSSDALMRGLSLAISMLILDFIKFVVSEKDFPDFLARGVLQGFVVLYDLGFIFPSSTPSHECQCKGKEVTALMQAGLQVFVLRFVLLGK